MSVGEVQARIAHIQSMMLAASSASTSARATASSTATGTTAASSATQFAAALDAAVAANGAAGTSGTTPTLPAGSWAQPTRGEVSSGFGPRWGTQHEGLDVAAGTGTPVRAVTGGVVKKASWYGGYGNAVIIDHGAGLTTLYGHNSALNVKAGDRVLPGQVIAKVGSTGDSTGPHLHFEVEVNGKKIDPAPWLKARGISI